MIIKNIVWDWNGTIVNDAYLFVEIMNLVLDQKKLPLINILEYKKKFCFPIQDYWKKLGFKLNESQFNKMNSMFIRLYKTRMKEPPLQDGILNILLQLSAQNIKQFVLSASEHTILNEMVRFYNLSNCFEDVVGVDNLNANGKKIIGNYLFKKHNLNPHETIIVGDTEYDLRVANNLGCGCVLLSCGHFNRSRLLAVHGSVVENVQGVLKFL